MRRSTIAFIMLLVGLTLGFFFSVPVSYASDNELVESEIERIEYGDGVKITYYKNGTKLVEVYLKQDINVGASVGTAVVRAKPDLVPPEPQLINVLRTIDLVLDIVRQVTWIILGILGIFGITLYIRRKKKPPYVVIQDNLVGCGES